MTAQFVENTDVPRADADTRRIDGLACPEVVAGRRPSARWTEAMSSDTHQSPVVVLVDDDGPLLEALTLSLETEGFRVLPYASAEALLADRNLPPRGCLVLDQKLPGMDGLALLTRLRSDGIILPATLITTPSAAITRRAAAAGVSIVEKPLQGQNLAERVREMLS